jgi:hypothetical protein
MRCRRRRADFGFCCFVIYIYGCKIHEWGSPDFTGA